MSYLPWLKKYTIFYHAQFPLLESIYVYIINVLTSNANIFDSRLDFSGTANIFAEFFRFAACLWFVCPVENFDS